MTFMAGPNLTSAFAFTRTDALSSALANAKGKRSAVPARRIISFLICLTQLYIRCPPSVTAGCAYPYRLPEFLPIKLKPFFYRVSRSVFAFETGNRHFLILKLFVSRVEMFYFFKRVLVYIAKVLSVNPARVVLRNGDNFIVAFAGVHHVHERYRPRFDQNARQERVGSQKHHVEGVVVMPIALRNEPVVEGEVLGGMSDAVKRDKPGFLVYLVFVF